MQECVVNTAKKTLQFGEQGPVVTLTNSSMSKSVVAQVELMLDKSLQLPACSEMEVMIKAPGGVAGKTWILKTTKVSGMASSQCVKWSTHVSRCL